MKTHFIFDFDDTITNSYDHNQQLFVDTFLPHFPDINSQLLRDVHFASRGLGLDEQFQKVADILKLDISARQLVVENEQLHQKNYKKVEILNSVKELFVLLQQKGKKVSLCTNRQYGSLLAIIDHNKMSHLFADIISCKDEGAEKPNPKCLLDLIKKYNKPKSEFVYFGDSKTDYEFAQNAGIDSIIIDQYLNGKEFYRTIVESFM